MPDHDVTKMTFLGIRESITDENGDVYGDATLETAHEWKEHSEEKTQGDSTGEPVLCWDVTTDIYQSNYIYLGFRVRKSKSYSEMGWEDEISGLKLGEFGKAELAEWTKILKEKFVKLGINEEPKLFESVQEDIG